MEMHQIKENHKTVIGCVLTIQLPKSCSRPSGSLPSRVPATPWPPTSSASAIATTTTSWSKRTDRCPYYKIVLFKTQGHKNNTNYSKSRLMLLLAMLSFGYGIKLTCTIISLYKVIY